MLNSGAQPSASGKINFVQNQNKTQSSLTISVRGVKGGIPYDVVVDGVVKDQISVGASGRGKVVHRSRSRGSAARSLPYDPRGSTVQIASDGGVILSAEVPETGEECDQLIEIPLDLTPAPGVTGEASAEFKTRGGRIKFDVQLEGVAAGTYDLVVAGATAGQITVAGDDDDGEISFDSSPTTESADEPGEEEGGEGEDEMDLLLTFDPRGQLIEIQQAGVTLFSGTLPTEPPPGESPDDPDDDDGQGGDGGTD